MNTLRRLTRTPTTLTSKKIISSPWLACNYSFTNQAQSSKVIRVENPYTRETHCEVPTVDLEGAKKVKSIFRNFLKFPECSDCTPILPNRTQ